MKTILFIVTVLITTIAGFCEYTTCDECRAANCKWCSDGCHTILGSCTGVSECTANCSALNAYNMASSYCSSSVTGCSGLAVDDYGACSMKDTNGVYRAIAEWCYCAPGYVQKDATTCYLSSHGPAFLGASLSVAKCVRDIACTVTCVHGTCNRTVGKCVCEAGWSGTACDTPATCTDTCSYHGHCTAPLQCVCDPHWGGAICAVCAVGWSGTTCDTPICSTQCSGHGICWAPEQCACYDQWSGSVTCDSCGPTWNGTYCNESTISDDPDGGVSLSLLLILFIASFFVSV